MRNKLYEFRADLLLLTVAIAWGVTFLMVQDAISTTPVYAFLFFRFALASILMFIISYRFLNELNKKTILYGVILGILLFSAFATQTFGLIYTKSSIVAFITGLNVICVPFLTYLFFKDKIKLIQWVYHYWLIDSGYETTTNPSYTIYRKNHFLSDDEEFVLDYYLPIRYV